MNNFMEKGNGYIKSKTFYWIMGIIIAGLFAISGYLTARMDLLNNTFNHNITTIKVDISEMKSDIGWIKNSLQRSY